VVQNLKIAESSVFVFSRLFVWHSSGGDSEWGQLGVWLFVVWGGMAREF